MVPTMGSPAGRSRPVAPRVQESAVERMLLGARRRLERLTPAEVRGELGAGAVLIDIRPERQRRLDGDLPQAVVICRNVLEWRCDPSSEWCDERLADPARRLIVICNEGFQSSLAAASLQALGRERATDVVGGFQAWRESGLPVAAAAPRRRAQTDREGAGAPPGQARRAALATSREPEPVGRGRDSA